MRTALLLVMLAAPVLAEVDKTMDTAMTIFTQMAQEFSRLGAMDALTSRIMAVGGHTGGTPADVTA